MRSSQNESIQKLRDAVAKARCAAEDFIQAWHEHERQHPFPHVDDLRRSDA